MATHEIELKVLMLASLDGDAVSYQALLHQVSRRLRAYYKGKLARFGRGAAETEDLVQEALLAIHFKRHTYDLAEPLTPWVHAIARYKLIDFLRRTRTSLTDAPGAGGRITGPVPLGAGRRSVCGRDDDLRRIG
jgi:RNA polymerase sigma-70 factor (ECF subfamily)